MFNECRVGIFREKTRKYKIIVLSVIIQKTQEVLLDLVYTCQRLILLKNVGSSKT